MHITIIGLGGMGSALAGRLLDLDHEVAVWNRSPGRSDPFAARGARVLPGPDDVDPATDAVVVCLADDDAVLSVTAPDGRPRPAWRDVVVTVMATVAPETVTTLHDLYGRRLLASFILGAPHAVVGGSARWIVGGDPATVRTLEPLWHAFADTIDAGDSPARAAAFKMLQNQMLLAGLAVVAETLRLGRASGIDDTVLVDLLRSSPLLAPGLQNRVDGLVDPAHEGWFTSPLAAKDLTHALGLAADEPAYPVTRAARDAYRQVAADGWADVDITALVELGTTPGAESGD